LIFSRNEIEERKSFKVAASQNIKRKGERETMKRGRGQREEKEKRILLTKTTSFLQKVEGGKTKLQK